MAGALAQKRHNPRSGWRYSGSGAARGEFLLKGYWRYLEARAEALVKRCLARDTWSAPSWPLLVAVFIDR